MPRFRGKKPRVVTPPTPAQEVMPAVRQGSSPTGSDNSNQQVSSEGSRRVSPGTLRARFIQEVKRGGSAVRRGIANLGEGFGTRTPSASVVGAGEQLSSPPSPTPQVAPTPETASDRLAPLPETPKRGLRFKVSFGRLPKAGFKRAASEAMSDSEGSVSGSSRGAASTGTPAVRSTEFGSTKDTTSRSSAGLAEVLLTPPSPPSARLPFSLVGADSPTPAPRVRYDATWQETALAEKEKLSDDLSAPAAPVVGPQYSPTPPDAKSSPIARISPLSQDDLQSQQPLSQRQRRVLEMRDRLMDLCVGLDRQARWYPTLHDLADSFVYLLGQEADCSCLIEAVPFEHSELEAPRPLDDQEALQQVRERFLHMAPHLLPYLEHAPLSKYLEPQESWNLPPAAREDPRGFWAKIFDSFDFSSPQYFDTTLPLDQQPKDAFNYLANFDILPADDISLSYKLRRPRSRDNLGWEDANAYEEGCRMLREMLDLTFGIRIRPRKQEPAIPFPWLDCDLTRFKAFGWTYEYNWHYLTGEPFWTIDYGDAEHPYDPLHRSLEDDHFSPYTWMALLVTNVRVPLPRKIQEHPPSLGNAMSQVYSQYHPMQMLGEARTLIPCISGDEYSDTDLQAAMLYQLVSRLSKSNPAFFDIVLGEEPQTTEEEVAPEEEPASEDV